MKSSICVDINNYLLVDIFIRHEEKIFNFRVLELYPILLLFKGLFRLRVFTQDRVIILEESPLAFNWT